MTQIWAGDIKLCLQNKPCGHFYLFRDTVSVVCTTCVLYKAPHTPVQYICYWFMCERYLYRIFIRLVHLLLLRLHAETTQY